MKDTTLCVRLGELLRERRRHLRLSMSDVATYVGVSWQQIQRYEQGRTAIPIDRLCALCAALNVPPTHALAVLQTDAPEAPFAERASTYLPHIHGAEKQQAVMTVLQYFTPSKWQGF